MKLVDLNELVKLTGIQRKTLYEQLKSGEVQPVDQKGKKFIYDSVLALRCIYQGSDPNKAMREREAKARTEKLEIEVAQMKGELVEINVVANAVENEYTIVRQRLLTIPSKMAKPLSFMESPTEIQNTLTNSICELLEELRHDKEAEKQAERNSKENSEATTKKKAGSVGRPRKASVTRKQR